MISYIIGKYCNTVKDNFIKHNIHKKSMIIKISNYNLLGNYI